MATFAVSKKNLIQPSVKGLKLKYVRVTGDTDIGAEDVGYEVTAASLGMQKILGCIGNMTTNGVYFVSGVPIDVTGVAGVDTRPGPILRLQYFNADDAVEAAAGENGVDGTIVDLIVIGW